MTFAMWTGIAVIVVSTVCFLLMQRAEARKGAAARGTNGASDYANLGGDGGSAD